MKTLSFQKLRKWMAAFALCLFALHASAQQHNIVITGTPETKCILPNEGPYCLDELPKTLVACQGSDVSYTAHFTITGTYNVIGLEWEVSGGSITNNTNTSNPVQVAWGYGETGELTFTVIMDSGRVLTHHQTVHLIAPPVVSATTVPEGKYNHHTIYVCSGGSVEFTDNSDAGNSDIAGYYWSGGPNGDASTRSYTAENITYSCDVTHRVYNNCGCYAEEVFHIEVQAGDPLRIDCYGTACEGSTVTYHALSPSCTDYLWTVEGGTPVAGQNTPDITVLWDQPSDGYGIVSIDGTACGGNACPDKMSVKIPIIQNGVSISGPTTVCQGEGCVYSVPLFGSTAYEWTIIPNVAPVEINGANQIEYIFTVPGTYQLYVKYKCEFLECGEFKSLPLTIEVKPRLTIVGDDEMCITNIGTLETSPSDNAYWTVFKEGNAQPIYTSQNLEPSPHPTFSQAGRYKVIAWNSAYCNDAEFYLTVKDGPPAPTASDMDPDNPDVACLYSSIRLKATPIYPIYNLIWEPSCSTAEPSSVSGNDVTIAYQNEVCDVLVYNYDPRLQCRSAGYYTHEVEPFALKTVNIPSNITVCPGTRIKWTDADVPPQDGVTYEWRLQDNKQYCATIEGDIYKNTATLLVNDFVPALTNSNTFEVHLIRSYCSDTKDTTKIQVDIANLNNSALQITAPASTCQNQIVTFSGTGCNNLDWYFSNGSGDLHGTPVDHVFTEAGTATVILSCNPYDYCSNSAYIPHVSTTMTVHPAPPLFSLGYDGTFVYTVPQLSNTDYTFQWGHTATNNGTVLASPNVDHYSCTVTSTSSPNCSRTVASGVEACGLLNVVQSGSMNYCTKNVSFHVTNPPGTIVWDLSNFSHGTPIYSGSYNENITVPVTSVGNLTITASTQGTPCWTGSAAFTVDFVPMFSFEKQCSTIVVHNHSRYLDGTKQVTLSVNGSPLPAFPVSQASTSCTANVAGSYTFKLTGYNGITLDCSLGTVEIENTSNQNVSITTANTVYPGYTCDNTAIELTASIPSPHSIAHAHWDFGDNGSCIDTVGDNVYHTFRNTGSAYSVALTVTDENGCNSTGYLSIQSNNNDLKSESLQIISTPTTTCPGDNIDIEYHANTYPLLPGDATYYWSTQTAPSNQGILTVHYTDDYSVIVKNDNYCEARASVNVGFLNKPTALIIPKKYYYCIGEEIELSGRLGDGGSYLYDWTISSPYDNYTITEPTGKISFPTPSSPCAITVTLEVRDPSSPCSSDPTSVVINVVAPPPAPNIGIGPNCCIGNPPVDLVCYDQGLDVHWSNGKYGNMANYFYPGYATAHYYDLVSGCRSELAEIRIPAAPDFDALLTGCYKTCQRKAFGTLPVYGLLPVWQMFNWRWHYNTDPFTDDDYNVTTPINLSLHGFDEYILGVDYFMGCHGDSKPLVLQEDSVCRCDSIKVTCSGKYYMQGCSIIYNVTVTVCNKSSRSVCFTSLTPLFGSGSGITMTSTDFTSLSIAPYDCTTFQINLSVTSLASPSAMFRMRDRNCLDCEKVFSVDLRPLWEDLNINCSRNVAAANGSVAERGSLSDVQKFYYDFDFDLSSIFTSPSVIAVWSSPGTVIDYSMSTSFHLSGLGVFDRSSWNPTGTLCIHALVCDNGQPCIVHYCITMMNIDLAPSLRHLAGNEKSLRQDAVTGDVTEPQLIPNPTTGDVSIVGTSDEVEEVLVMDMNGRKMATFDKTDHFNVAALPSGIYIVRVRTSSVTDGDTSEVPQKQVTYLKLVKK